MWLTYPIFLCQHLLRKRASANHGYVLCGKAPVPVVEAVVVPQLVSRIPIVVGDCPEPQMAGAHAWRVVANVHNDLPLRNLPDEFFVNEAMGHNTAAPVPTTADINDAITKFGPISYPKPAGRSFLDSAFKGHTRQHRRISGEPSAPTLNHVMRFTKISAEGVTAAKQTFPLSFWHNAIMPQL
jgi:hypothetical protein